DTVNKIFTLSKVHPIGLMIFGNANFMHYPWELIVKEYRDYKKLKYLKTTHEWALDFIKFVRRFGSITNKDIENNIRQIVRSTFKDQELNAADEAERSDIPFQSDEYHKILIRRLDEESARLGAERPWLAAAARRTFAQKYWRIVADEIGA